MGPSKSRFVFWALFAALLAVSQAKLAVVTVATEKSDGLQRLERSADAFGLKLDVFGFDEVSAHKQLNGAEKIRILREGMDSYKVQSNLIVLYIDAQNGLLNGDERTLTERFLKLHGDDHRIIFASDELCLPDEKLAEKYPKVDTGKRFLNSAMFMGYANDIWKMINAKNVEDNDPDGQTFYTHIFLDENLRKSLRIGLDTTSKIFQNVDDVVGDLNLEFEDNGDAFLHNTVFKSRPVVLSGSRSGKLYINYLGNYLGKAWSAETGCRLCPDPEEFSILKSGKEEKWPTVTLALFIPKPIPFVTEFLSAIDALSYPKQKIDLYVYNNQKYNVEDVDNFVKEGKTKYRSVEVDNNEGNINERDARRIAITMGLKSSNDFVFMVDAEIQFTEPEVLRSIIETSLVQNIGIIAPLIGKPKKLYSNFWGGITEGGYYSRSEDYEEILYFKRVGVWNVPFINAAVLIHKNKMEIVRDAFMYKPFSDSDMSFCEFARDKGHFLFVDNRRYYGFLVESDTFDTTKVHPEMYQIFENRELWEGRYLHPGYAAAFETPVEDLPQPCPDVYDYPLMSERFAKELVEEMENFGKWSGGKHQDERLAGGYENVPTVDIHMNQIDFERQWLYFLDEFVRPMQEKIFIGYYEAPVKAIMMFVVRYKPGEQPSLRAHHDASTYTVDIPLNKRGIDFEGGGVKYIRYNCTVAADQVGHAAMFPGRLTHLHEGLLVTKGIRYIAVSFLNP